MLSDLGIILLHLTKNREQVSLKELADHLYVAPDIVQDQIMALNEKGLVAPSGDIIELNAAKRISLANHLIRNGHDLEKVSRSLKWQEFEDFGANLLTESGYRTLKHLIFKSRVGRREIDLIAWNNNFILTIDCKHWSRRLSPSRVQAATSAQTERTKLLAQRPEVLVKHGLKITEVQGILPVIMTLTESNQRIVNGVPVVPIMKMPSFLYGVSPVDETLTIISLQTRLPQATLV